MDCATPTFPRSCRALPRLAISFLSQILWDLDADGKQEIFVAGHSGIFGVDDDGRLLPGFPLLMAAPPTGTPVVWDLDGDGRLALAALDGEAVYAWGFAKGGGCSTAEGRPIGRRPVLMRLGRGPRRLLADPL